MHTCAEKKADVFEEGHGPEDVLPLLAQTAIRAAQEKGEEDTAKIQALIQHEVDFMQVGVYTETATKGSPFHLCKSDEGIYLSMV